MSTVSNSMMARLKHMARKRWSLAAYTVMEVMMALGVLSVGATGVIALQKATIIGNLRARNLATANAVAAAWVERLRVDALRWKQNTNGSSTILNTQWLATVGADHPTVTGNENVWIRPAPIANYAPEADVRGKDVVTLTATNEPGFCTNIRLTQLTPSLIRAEVRVFWLRQRGGGTLGGVPLCSDDPAYITGIEAERGRYHFVYLTTGILRNDSGD